MRCCIYNKWLLLYNNYEMIAQLSYHPELNRSETMSHSHLYSFGCIYGKYEIVMSTYTDQYIDPYYFIWKKVTENKFNRNFWNKIFSTGSMYACDRMIIYILHMIFIHPIIMITKILVDYKIMQCHSSFDAIFRI